MTNFTDRIIRAAKLDVTVYEEVEDDKGALSQSMAVVVLSSVAAGLASIEKLGFSGIVIGTIIALISWYVWAYVIYFIGTKVLQEPQTYATHGQVLRTIGFASSPGLIRILGIIPGLTWIVVLAASLWMLAAMVIAVRQALDYQSTVRAVVVCIIGWIFQALILALLFSLVGGFGKLV